MSVAMNTSIIEKFRVAKVPEYRDVQFTASKRVFHNSGRSTLTEGILATREAGKVSVVVKSLNKAFAVGRLEEMKTQKYKDKLLAYFTREADIWMRASSHPNIAGIMGFMPSFGDDTFPVLVFHFFPMGDLRYYITNEGADANDKTKLQFLRDIACGLEHLHSLQPPIVHRDLTASNVLLKVIPTRIIACINDFGSAKLMDPAVNVVYSSSKSCSFAWEPPEYVKSKTFLESYTNPKPSGDIWSFGCVFLEVLTGSDPWPTNLDVFRELEKGHHPPRPRDVELKDEHWKFLQGCWKLRPTSRYPTEKVVACLDRFITEEK